MPKTRANTYFEPQVVEEKEAELRCEGYSSFLDSAFLQRLKGVSFLGVLDFVYQLDTPSNRYDHSVCVSHLALQVARRLSLPRDMERAYVIASILHDVGHAAFSHNSEPFLLEQLKLYHQGLASAYFMYSNRFAPEGTSLVDLLSRESDFVAQSVPSLILQSRSAVQPLETLFHSPLNCDKIEGNFRTMLHLGRESIEPDAMLELFVMHDNKVSINTRHLGLVIDFWQKERDVYWHDIYTSAVFAAEAMLTRALELYFEGPNDAESFLLYTDNDAINVISLYEDTNFLINGLRQNKLFLSLHEEHPEILAIFAKRLKENRFDKIIRTGIEAEIAKRLGVKPTQVISHFSRRKYFSSRFYELKQMELFENDTSHITLEKVSGAFQNSKRAGDFFDVFYLPQEKSYTM